jgi:alkaline phosphatase D
VVTVTSDAIAAELVCIPRTLERSREPDGGPLLYRVVHRARVWQAGERLALERVSLEGTTPLSL